MAFVKKTWKDRIVQYANRRLLTKSGGEVEQVTVTRDEGTISEAGDQFNASNMNDLEQRVKDGFDELTASDIEYSSGVTVKQAIDSKANTSTTYTKSEVDTLLNNKKIASYSLINEITLTTTETTYNTYSSRKFSDYDLLIFKAGVTVDDIRDTNILPSSIWASGKSIDRNVLHGSSSSSASSYSISTYTIKYNSDTSIKAKMGASTTVEKLSIIGVKLL